MSKAGLASREAGASADYEQQELQEAVRRILAVLEHQLPKLSYHTFYSHWLEGHSVGEIAAELGVSQVIVRCRLFKAKRKFRLLCERNPQKNLLTEY